MVIDEDADASWSVVQSDTLLSAKRVLAGVALASSLAHGIQQQADDFPSAPLLHGHENIDVVAVGRDPLPFVFWSDEEIVPQAAVFTPDEDYDWQPFVAKTTRPLSVWETDDPSFPSLIHDHDSIQIVSIGRDQLPSIFESNEEIVSQPVVFTPDEEYWQSYPLVVSKPVVALWTDDDFPVTFIEETAWQVDTPVYKKPVVSLWTADEEIVPQPAIFTPFEEYWLEFSTYQAKIEIVNWPVTGNQSVAVTAQIVDDTYWQVYTPAYKAPIAALWSADDFPQQAAPQPALDEAAWLLGKPEPSRLFVQLWNVEDECPSAAADIVPTGSSAQRAFYKSTVLRWVGGNEDFPQQPQITFDESIWQVHTPAYKKPIVTVWTLDDQIAIPLLDVSEFRMWHVSPENRAYMIAASGRAFIIGPENRTYQVGFEDRDLGVGE